MTTTKKDFSNYGTLAKTARGFNRISMKHYLRSVYDHSPESVKEVEDINAIAHDIETLAGDALGSDIACSMRYGNEILRAGCFDHDFFGFRLGVLTALRFKKVLYRIPKSKKETFIDTANQSGWKFYSQTWEGDTCVDILLINKRQVKD